MDVVHVLKGQPAEAREKVLLPPNLVLSRGVRNINKGKVQKKKLKKNLTSVSFAFTHTYTPVKTNIFPFFPKHTWKILKNVQKRATWAQGGGGGGANSPL